MNHFAALRALTRLSVSASAHHLGVKEDTSKSWTSGRRTPPEELLDRLRNLAAFQETEAARIASDESQVEDDVLVLDAPVDDQGARDFGWPSLGAWLVLAGRVMMLSEWDVEYRTARIGARHEGV